MKKRQVILFLFIFTINIYGQADLYFHKSITYINTIGCRESIFELSNVDKKGYVRLVTPEDNARKLGQLSSAGIIKIQQWTKGMMIIEHPKRKIDIAMKEKMTNMYFTPLNLNFFYIKYFKG